MGIVATTCPKSDEENRFPKVCPGNNMPSNFDACCSFNGRPRCCSSVDPNNLTVECRKDHTGIYLPDAHPLIYFGDI